MAKKSYSKWLSLLVFGLAIIGILIVWKRSSRPKVGILAIFKNESMVIREWIDHYKWQGVDHILLMDNNSTDDYKSKLKGTESFVTVVPAPIPHNQEGYYNTVGIPFFKKKKIDIILPIDLDEYLFMKDGTKLAPFLRKEFSKPDRPSQILIQWTMFGSNGFETQPSSIRKSFLLRKQELDRQGKCIVFLPDVTTLHLHWHDVKGKSETRNDVIQLNHYAIMSKEYFQKVKMTRGDATEKNLQNFRDWNYFERYDHKEEKDTKLADLVHQSGL